MLYIISENMRIYAVGDFFSPVLRLSWKRKYACKKVFTLCPVSPQTSLGFRKLAKGSLPRFFP